MQSLQVDITKVPSFFIFAEWADVLSLTGYNVSTDATMLESDEKARSSRLSGFSGMTDICRQFAQLCKIEVIGRTFELVSIDGCCITRSPGRILRQTPTNSALYLMVDEANLSTRWLWQVKMKTIARMQNKSAALSNRCCGGTSCFRLTKL